MPTIARSERLRRIEGRLLQVPASRPALATMAHDRRLGGPLLAGALAFRLFAVLLPLALVIAVALGYAATLDDSAPGTLGNEVGIRAATLHSISQSSRLEAQSRWVVLAFSVFALVYAAVKAGRTVHAAHSLAWTGQAERVAHQLLVGLGLLVVVAGIALVWAGVGRSRADLGFGGFLIALFAVIPFAAIWLAASWLLPHGDAPLSALVPGAILFGVGLQLIHLGTVLVIAHQIERASSTYGPMGAAATILVWLFILSRVVVASAMLNVVLWRHRGSGARTAGDADPSSQT